MTMKAIQVHQTGSADQLRFEDIAVPTPGPGQALIKIQAAGVNFIDIYHRIGLYPKPMPFTPGMEASGTVVALGPDTDVEGIAVDTAVASADVQGAYAEYAIVKADRLVAIPGKLDFPRAAAAMLQGMTAHYLVHSTYPISSGDVALVHAAAGGTGLLLVQMIKALGGRVIGTASTAAKAAAAIAAGADLMVNYTTEDFEKVARDFTDGRGVDVVYDSVGASTFEKSLNSLRPRGMMVTFGNASGPVPEFKPLVLSQKGSLFLTRPTLAHYISTRDELLERANEVLTDAAFGKLQVTIGGEYVLAEAAAAQTDLETRKTSGKLLLIP